MMNTKEALQLLKNTGITNSNQMLLRWIRQGKIAATMTARSEGYEIDQNSLFDFIHEKQRHPSEIEKTIDYQVGYRKGRKEGLEAGYQQGLEKAEESVKKREKELIQKEFYETSFSFNYFDLAKKKQAPKKVLAFMYSLDLIELKIGVLGSWAMLKQTYDLIDIDRLPYPNRRLETRLRQGLVELMEEKLKEETRK